MTMQLRKTGISESNTPYSPEGRLRLFRILVLLLLLSVETASALEIVSNPDVPVSRLSMRELHAIFTMRLRAWPNGLPVKVFVLHDSSPMHIEFAKKVMDMFPYQLRRYWDKLVFSGTGQAPVELDNERQVYEHVATTPGAIGYLPATLIDSRINIVKVSEQ
ncbi:hypothetical protein [Methyloterricola oryzae]|uniref:hypothetical protein n=1 Tax=Methyloterricola oryzae TaxID=1495050 RepID=UPI001F2C8E4D|nr:hypothetical protein [Methyloterricola oryzae]